MHGLQTSRLCRTKGAKSAWEGTHLSSDGFYWQYTAWRGYIFPRVARPCFLLCRKPPRLRLFMRSIENFPGGLLCRRGSFDCFRLCCSRSKRRQFLQYFARAIPPKAFGAPAAFTPTLLVGVGQQRHQMARQIIGSIGHVQNQLVQTAGDVRLCAYAEIITAAHLFVALT